MRTNLKIIVRFAFALAIAAAIPPLAASAQTGPMAEATNPTNTIRGTFLPIRVEPAVLEANITFYEGIFGQRNGLRFKFPEHDLEFAIVGPVALIAGSESSQRHLPKMDVIFVVDSLAAWRDRLLKSGATILQEASPIPTGMNMFARNLGGQIFEYVQIDPKKAQAVNLIKPR